MKIDKGYLIQAQSAIEHVNPSAAGYEHNLGLLKLLQGNYEEAYQILLLNHADTANFKIAKK